MHTKKKNTKMTVKKGKKQARVALKQKARPAKKIVNKVESEKKPVDNKSLLIAQEVKFARLLANNDKKVRDKVLKNLKKWLTVRSQSSFPFTKDDFARLWKGLFYCMWMSDKPLVQEDLAEAISKIVHCLNSLDTALLYTKCTLKSLADEWFGIDRFRIDKFEMLVRKIIRETFEVCKRQSWDKQWVVGMAKAIEDILLDPACNLGFKLHITDVYMEELAKIGEEEIPKSMVTEFVRPFVMYLVCINDLRQSKQVIKNIFRYLIFQSDVGMEYSEKFNAWREAGFPCSSIDEIQKVEVSDDEEEEKEEEEEEGNQTEISEKPLDPRAGRVDVEIPQILFDPAEIAALLKENKFHKSSTSKTRKHITRLINDFTKLIQGDMPFGIKNIKIPSTDRIDPNEAAEELVNLNEELLVDSSKNYRKRKKNGDITEIEDDEDVLEESDSETNQKAPVVKKLSSNKKQKLSENDINEKSKDKIQNSKEIKQTNQLKKKDKKKMKRLNVSEPLPKKKLAKSSKKLNNTVVECVDEAATNSAKNTSIKESANNKWEVDTASPSATKTPTKVLENKKSTKGTAIPEKEAETNLLKNNIPWLTPVLTRLEEQNKTPTPKSTPQQTPKSTPQQTPKTDSVKKRVKIVLQRNMAQNTSEYIKQIRQSPAIPFDANRKPKVGVLKPSPLPSPVNPFYKRKIF